MSNVGDEDTVLQGLDLSAVEWIRAEPAGASLEDCVEYSFVRHTDDVVYTAMRKSSQPEGPVLVFTPAEWRAFVKGVKGGEFDLPAEGE